MIGLWIKGAVKQRWQHQLLGAAGIAAATALVGTIGVFGIASGDTMTARALSAVPLDWQVALAAGADAPDMLAKLAAAAPLRAARVVGYADAASLSATSGGTIQTTGSGQILGLPADYAVTFPGQMRSLLGSATGVLLAQQTASNLHVTIGDAITLTPAGAAPFDVKVDGIVDLLNADALFQTIVPQKGPGATAPSDNVVLLPMDVWNAHFLDSTRLPGGGARLQIHAALNHANLPAAPDAAFVEVSGKARNLEVRAAGEAAVGDNLAARLGAVRQDAIFARILLLFLGLPGVVLGLLLTIAIARSDATRQRREQALLGLRGASALQVALLALADGGLVALAGTLGGMALAALLATSVLHIFLAAPAVLAWLAFSGIGGFLMALACIVLPTLLDLRASSVASRRSWLAATSMPLWRQVYADFGLIALAALIFWHSASTGYQVVLAPEGVATAAVDYTAFLAPLLFWTGCGLLILRLSDAALRNGRSVLKVLLAPLSARLADTAAASLSRQHRRIARGTALVALAFAFAAATAIFNTTYNLQQLVDARLTNGADVAITGTAAFPAGEALERILAVPDVAAAELMQHRFAYVGKDLQDLYGIDPATIGKATDIVDAYFGTGGASATLARLAATPDGVLVSQETVNDFQLSLGDLINLRLQGTNGPPKTVPFHFIGIVNEFPTAPHDSFLVANAAYIAAQTGSAGAEVVLVRAKTNPPALAAGIRDMLGANTVLRTSDISQAAHLIGSSLTAVDLGRLGAIELAFALVFIAMAMGLTLWLGQNERARIDAIFLSLGATRNDVRAFLWGEALVMLGIGLVAGALIGLGAAWMLVRLLGGVFDPAPDALSYPWMYIALVLAGAAGSMVLAVLGQAALSKEAAARQLRAGR